MQESNAAKQPSPSIHNIPPRLSLSGSSTATLEVCSAGSGSLMLVARGLDVLETCGRWLGVVTRLTMQRLEWQLHCEARSQRPHHGEGKKPHAGKDCYRLTPSAKSRCGNSCNPNHDRHTKYGNPSSNHELRRSGQLSGEQPQFCSLLSDAQVHHPRRN